MLPGRQLNIYPKTRKNLKALMNFYFDKYDIENGEVIDMLIKKQSLSLNQIEFIASHVARTWTPVWRKHFTRGTTVANLMRHAIEGIVKTDESEWDFPPTSKSRIVTREFVDYIRSHPE